MRIEIHKALFILCVLLVIPWCSLGRCHAQTEGADQDPDAGAALPREKLVRWWPLLYVERHPDGLLSTDAFFFMWRSGRGPLESYLDIFPFYWSHKDVQADTAFSLLIPAYYYSREPDEWKFLSLPFATGETTDHSRWTIAPGVAPLYRRSVNAVATEEALGIPYVFDIESRFHQSDGASGFRLLNLFPWGETARAGLPVFNLSHDASGELTGVGVFPLFRYAAEEEEQQLILWPLLYGRTWTETGSRQLFVPLLAGSEQQGEGYRWTALAGLWEGGRVPEEDREWLRLEPFFSRSKTATGGAFSILRTYGYRWDDKDQHYLHDILQPIGRFESWQGGYRQRVFPFYFAGKTGENQHHLWLPPFYFSGRTGENSSYFAVAPLYFQHVSGEDVTRLVVPVYYESRTGNRGTQVGFPIYWRTWAGEHRSLSVLPVYTTIRNPEQRLDLVLGPVYVRQETYGDAPSRSDSFLWPLFEYRSAGDDWHFHVAPVAWFTRRGEHRFSLVAPLYLYAEGKDYKHHWIVPVYGYYEQADEDGAVLERSFYGGGAVIHSKVRRGDTLVSESLDVLGPIAGMRRNHEDQSSMSRVLPLWWSERSQDKELTVLMPVYVHRSSGQGEERRSQTYWGGNIWVDLLQHGIRERGFLWPLTRYQTGQDTTRLDVLGLFSKQHQAERDALRISPFYFERQGTPGRFDPVSEWLHVYSRQEYDEEVRTRVMPFLYGSRTRPRSRRWDAMAGLFGGERSPELSETRVLPFYYERREGPETKPESELQLVFPFYFRGMTAAGDRTSTGILFPFYSHTSVGSSELDEYYFPWPLVRRATSPDLSEGHVLPFFKYSFHSSGRSDWKVMSLFRARRLPAGIEARDAWSRQGYFDFSLVQSTRGENSRTWTLNPFLFGYHRNDAEDLVQWDLLLNSSGYRRHGDVSSFHALVLAAGQEDEHQSSWRVTPIAYSKRLKEGTLPSFLLGRALHLYSQASDSNEQRWSILGLLASGKRTADSSEFLILQKFVRNIRNKGGSVELAVEPLFTWEDDPRSGRHYFSVLWFLYTQERRSHDEKMCRRLLVLIPLP